MMRKKQHALLPPKKREQMKTAMNKGKQGAVFKQKKIGSPPEMGKEPKNPGSDRSFHMPVSTAKEINNQKLFEACKTGNLNQMKSLLDQGADVDARDNYGNTPLMWVCFFGDEASFSPTFPFLRGIVIAEQ